MVRILVLIIVISWCVSCSPKEAVNCFKASGGKVQREIEVSPFKKIYLGEHTSLVVRQGLQQQVVISSGKNQIDNIKAWVEGETLQIHNNTSCNFVRDYGTDTVYVTSPDLVEIRSSSGFPVKGKGLLRYPVLSLLSEDFNSGGSPIDGDFTMDLDVEELTIIANGFSKFYISGRAERAFFGLYSGDCRVYSEDLRVNYLEIFHRSSGPMVVNPVQSLKGKIVSLGDVICVGRPIEVEVEELYKGKLIYR